MSYGRWPVFAALVGLYCLAPRWTSAQTVAFREPVVPEKAGKEFHAFRITGTAPRLDGTLDDEAWLKAQAIDDMVQNEPVNMAPPRDRMVVQIAYDDRTLYMAVQCLVGDPSSITTGLGRRDNLPPSDLIRISIDARHDHQNAYVFETNPSGMQSDYLFYEDTRQSTDYDAVWDVRTTITDKGWFAEFAVPFSQMRFTVPEGDQVVWGFNIRRDTYKTGEYDRWVPTPRGAAGFVSRFGHLIFDEALRAPRRLELMPFTLGRSENDTASGVANGLSGGFDARIGLGPGITLSTTLNPDFGQVEQDPAVLNLSVFENFFPERRPFFLEDSRLFVPSFNQMIMFHSRRIGRAPARISLPTGDTEPERPSTTTILGAAKVTGRTGKWTYGGISALTDSEYAAVSVADVSSGFLTNRDRLVEPRTSYNVARVQRDLRAGTSNVGGIFTSTLRDGNYNAYTGSSDFTVRWDRTRGSINGQWATTHAAIDKVMRTGYGGVTNFNWSRKYFGVNGHVDRFSPTFRNTDLGFLSSRVDKTSLNVGLNIHAPDPRGLVRSWNAYQYGNRSWNSASLVFEKQFGAGFNINFMNFWNGYIEVWRDLDRLDDLDSRGGGAIIKPARWSGVTGFGTDSRKIWQFNVQLSANRDSLGGWGYAFGPSLRWRPRPELQTSISARYEPALDVAQWIKSSDVTGDGVTDYVYGTLRRDVVNVTARATYAFTRDMTLEAYLQPFVAVGRYSDLRRLARPNSFDFDPVTLTDNPDFSDKSLRSNIVFRWQYQQASALFLVWNRSTNDETRPGVFSGWRDLGNSFSGPGTDVFMVKLTYWLGL